MDVQHSRSRPTSKASGTGDWNPVRSGISRTSYRNIHTEYVSPSVSKNKCFGYFWYKAKIITVEPVLFLYMFALYLYLIVFELYSFNRYGKEAESDYKFNATGNHSQDFCLKIGVLDNITGSNSTENIIQSKTAILNLIIGTVGKLPSIFASLLLGPLSDRYGRKPAFIIIIIGIMLDAAITIIIIDRNLNLYFFILGSAVRGITGGVAGILTASYSYIADISSRKWLTFRLGALEASSFIAGTLSLVTGGLLAQYTDCDFQPAAWTILGCLIFALSYVIIVLPASQSKDGDVLPEEGRKQQQQQKKKTQRSIGLISLLRGFQIFFSRGYPRKKLWLALIAMMITILNTTGTVVIITLYLLHKPLQWDPYLIGTYMATSELVHGIVLLVFLPILIFGGIPDATIALLGIGLGCVMDIMLGFSEKTWQVFTVGIIQGMDSLILPSLKAIMSKTVEPCDQGALFSFISALQVLASMMAYLFYSGIYAKTIHLGWKHSAGISFFVMGILYVFAFFIAIGLLVIHRHEKLLTPSALQSRGVPASSPGQGERRQRLQSQPINAPTNSTISIHSPMPSHQSGPYSIQDDVFTSELGKEASGILSERARLLRENHSNDPFVSSYQSVASYHSLQ